MVRLVRIAKQLDLKLLDSVLEGIDESGVVDVESSGANDKDGVRISFHDNGIKKEEGSYVNGLKEGVFVQWHPNGQKKSEETYAQGERKGYYISWDENGNVLEEGEH